MNIPNEEWKRNDERNKRSLNCTKAHRVVELKRIVYMHNGDTDYNDLVSIIL